MKQGFRCGAALAALLALGGCHAPADGQASQGAPMELKIYTVPPAQTAPLAHALGNALGDKASVTMPSPGKLLVYAPRETQSSIGAALVDLGKAAQGQAAVAQVTLHFWVVDAQAGPGADDAALKPLAATLDALRQSMGPQHFHVDGIASATVENNHQGRLSTASNGSTRTFVFEVNNAGHDAAGLSLDYTDGLWQVKTTVGARYGEYLVLAQAPGVCPASFVRGVLAPSCATAPALRLVIVRADRLNPHALATRMTLREDALYASYRRLERPLYNVLYRQLWQAEDCQDVIHDAYVRVWERRAKVDESTWTRSSGPPR